jgi:hypothetical protein
MQEIHRDLARSKSWEGLNVKKVVELVGRIE